MSPTTNESEGFSNSAKLVKLLLTIVGVWPTSFGSSIFTKILQYFIIIASYFLLLFILAPSILLLFLKVRGGRKQLKLLAPIFNGLCQLFKYTVLFRRMNKFKETLNEIKEDWLNATEENLLILRTKAKIGHKVVLTLAITMYSGGLCYRTILPLSKGRIVLPNNTTIRLLPCPGYFAFIDEQLSPNYEIIFTLQVLAGFVSYTLLSGTTGVVAILCLHAASLLRILMNKVMALGEQSDVSEENVQAKIVEIVQHQMKIKRFLRNVELVTEHLCFFEIINDTCIACILGYCIILEWENSNAAAILIYIMLQTACVFTIFTICYIGQLLLDESNDLSRTAMTISWYHLPTKKARYLVLMINMINHPTKLTVAKVIDVSLGTFTDIMKMSMGYLNMFREIL